MNDRLLQQLLGSVDAAAQAPVNPYGEEFFAQSPAARLETLKMQKPEDPTGQALMQLLTRRMEREQGAVPMTSAEQKQPEVLSEETLLQKLQGLDPLAPLKAPMYQR